MSVYGREHAESERKHRYVGEATVVSRAGASAVHRPLKQLKVQDDDPHESSSTALPIKRGGCAVGARRGQAIPIRRAQDHPESPPNQSRDQ